MGIGEYPRVGQPTATRPSTADGTLQPSTDTVDGLPILAPRPPAIAIEAATYRVATLLIHRQRPQVHRLDQLPADASYYSGHTAASVAVYCGLALLITSRIRNTGARIVIWAIAIAIPLLVAVSRMY